MKIPKLSRAQKIALIIESGQNPFEKKRKRKEKGISRKLCFTKKLLKRVIKLSAEIFL